MAEEKQSWSIITRPQKTAIQEPGVSGSDYPEYDPQKDLTPTDEPQETSWSSIAQAPPEAIKDPTWHRETGYEGWTALKEGVKDLPKYFSQIPRAMKEVRGEVFNKVGIRDPLDYVPENVAIDALQNPVTGLMKLLDYGNEQGYFDPNEQYAQDREKKTKSVQYFEDLTRMAPQTILNYVASGVAGWGGIAATAGGQIFGGSYMKFRDKGNTATESAVLALADTAIQLPVEVLLTTAIIKGPRGMLNLGKKTPGMKRVFQNIEKGLKKKFPSSGKFSEFAQSYIGRMSGGAVAEGAEEFVQSLSEVVTEVGGAWARDEDITWDGIQKLIKEKTKEGLWSAMVAGPLGGAGGAVGRFIEGPKKAETKIIPDINPEIETTVVDPIKGKKDARAMLEEAAGRVLEVESAEAEAQEEMEQQIMAMQDPSQDLDVIGPDTVIGGPAPIGPDTVIGGPTPEAGGYADLASIEEEPAGRYRIETTPDDEAAEFYGFKKGDKKHAISITDKKSPAYGTTFVSEIGKEDRDISRKEMEFLAGKKDLEGYKEAFLAVPEARPEWATKTEVSMKPATDLEMIHKEAIAQEAETAYRIARGEDVRAESYSVKTFREYLDKKLNASDTYGDDFVRQVNDDELSDEQIAWKNIVETLYNRPVHFIDTNQAVKDDPTSPILNRRGARVPQTGGIVVTKGDNLRNTGTMFHELTHDMKRTAPQLYKKLNDFVNDNIESIEELAVVESELERLYGGDQNLIEEELVTGIVTDIMKGAPGQTKILDQLKEKDPKTFQRLIKYIKTALEKLKQHLTRNRNKKGFSSLLKDVNEATDFITKTLSDFQEIAKRGPAKGLTVEQVKKRAAGEELKGRALQRRIPKKKPVSKVRTLRGAIRQLGGINFLNFKGELKELPVDVKFLSKKTGTPIDIAEQALRDDGWISPDETLLDLLRDKNVLSRDRITRDVTEKKPGEMSKQELEFKKELEAEQEAPPDGDYITMDAEYLPKGKKLTIIENETTRGWDVYEVIEKDPFGVTLKDGKIIELKPGDKVQVLKEDITKEAGEPEDTYRTKPTELQLSILEDISGDNELSGKIVDNAIKSDRFNEWFKGSRVVDDSGKPKIVYSGHSNVVMYGEKFQPNKATAGGYYSTDNPEIASSYAMGKFGSKEYHIEGEQYRLKNIKTGKYNKKIWQYELSEDQLKKLNELKTEKDENGDFEYEISEMDNYIDNTKNYDKKVRAWSYRGGSNNLQNIFEFYESMGYNIAYPSDDSSLPITERQKENRFEELLRDLGIDWQSFDWAQPGIFPTFLSIRNPLDTSKNFPEGLLSELSDKSKREKNRSMEYISSTKWTKDYPLKEWVKDIKREIESGEEQYWPTQVPKKALKILKEFGYDGIKDVGGKGGGEKHSVWIAFDASQIKSVFDSAFVISPKEAALLAGKPKKKSKPKKEPKKKKPIDVGDDIRFDLSDDKISTELEKITKDWEGKGVKLYVHEGDNITIDTVIVPKEQRKTGIGSKIVSKITEYADSVGKRVVLSPAVKDDFQGTTSRARLVKFYKRFGFVENKGRNKDFTLRAEKMYRDPKQKIEGDIREEISAFHGSPHSFEKFETKHIGTGEGAQAFGHGLYFTDLEEIARGYAKSISATGNFPTINGKKMHGSGWFDRFKSEYGDEFKKIDAHGAFTILRGMDIDGAIASTEGDIKEILRLSKGKDIVFPKTKNLYKVTLHEGKEPSEYTWLDWDKPVDKELSAKILKKIEDEGVDLGIDKSAGTRDIKEGLEGVDFDSWLKGRGFTIKNGKVFNNKGKEIPRSALESQRKLLEGQGSYRDAGHFYRDLSHMLGSDAIASEFLLDIGIDGIRYPVGSLSGMKDTGAKNYVVFDERAVTVVEQIQFEIAPDKETQDILDRIGRKPQKFTDKLKERTDFKPNQFITAAVDKLNPLRKFAGSKSASYMMHRGLPGVQSSINAMMEHGVLEYDKSGVLTTKTKDKGFIPWLKDLGVDSDKFFFWLIAQRDQSRSRRDEKYKPMFTKEARNKLFSWTGKKASSGKSWGQVNKEFQVFNDSVLELGKKSGLLDPTMVKQFRDEFYIPFYRIFEDEKSTAEFIKAPVNTKKIIAAQIKKLRGSKRQIGDPLENILANWSHLIKQSMANASRRQAFEELQDVKTETGEAAVEEVPWSETVIFKAGKDDKTTFVYPKDNVEVLGFKDNGKTKFFKVNDPELFMSLSLQNNKVLPKWLAWILGAPKRLLTFGATITPSFMAANAARDTMHTYTISKGFKPFWDTAKGFIKTLRKDQDYVEYMASGNAFVGSYIKADNPEDFSKQAKDIVKREGRGALSRILHSPARIWRFWEQMTEASENATRLALYSKRRKEGYSILESSFEARDIMDFQMKGASPVVQYLTATVPFLNARIQGLYKMGTAMAENPGMYSLKGASIAMASIGLWAAFADDDRYKELEDWEKFSYYHFWIGDKHFRIPKPFETGVIWSSAWTAAADVMKGNNETKHITDFIGHSLLDTFAFNPIPQAAKPILEQYMNRVFFTGRPIESIGMKYKAPHERYYPWDHESAIVLGKALGVSPKRIQALVRGYLAGLGLGIMGAADMAVRQFAEFPEKPSGGVEDLPMVGRFVRSVPNRYSRYQSEFYSIFDELNMLHNQIRNAEREGDMMSANEMRKANRKKITAFGRAKQTRRNLSRIRKEVMAIWKHKVMKPDVKRRELDRLTVKRNEEVKKFYEWYQENR